MPVKHIPLLPLMFLFALLSGCAPAVIITSASVATRTATDPRTTGRQIDDGTLTLRVRHIWNETRTGFPVSTGQKVNDTWLASDIRARLLLNRDTRLADIKVVTENNEVFLMGLVTPEEGQRVADLVSRISGVTHVTTAWTFTQIPAQTPPAG
ncbi:BON domain-containing protein [Salmonella enterica]|uniref:BON domain-containing protein n=1 Tax=Salmonella enterica TaxID=28901 RepID=A0A744IVP3_SALER|nr:BON domain-containing protein [Salmonella enterica]HAF2530099.1 BON domain-containing protein [Salmonella enterica]